MVELSMKELKQEFKKLDKNGDGKIDEKELTKSLKMKMGKDAPNPKEIHELIESADLDGDHEISFKEFIASDAFEELLITSMTTTADDDDDDDTHHGGRKSKPKTKKKDLTEEELKKYFKRFDKNDDGKIDKRELTKFLMKMGQDPSKKEVNKLIKSADHDGDKEIDFDEFISSDAFKELLMKLKSDHQKKKKRDSSKKSSSSSSAVGASSASPSSPPPRKKDEGGRTKNDSSKSSPPHQDEEKDVKMNEDISNSLSLSSATPATPTKSVKDVTTEIGKENNVQKYPTEDYETIMSERNELRKTTKEQDALIKKLNEEITILKNNIAAETKKNGNLDGIETKSMASSSVGAVAAVDGGQDGRHAAAYEYLTIENERLNQKVKEYEEQIAHFTESAVDRELELKSVRTNSITWMKIIETNVKIIGTIFGVNNSNPNEDVDSNPTSTDDEEIPPK